MKRYSTNLNFLLSDEELLPLEKAANDRRVSKGHVIRELIRQNLAAQNGTSTERPLVQASR